MIYIITTDTFPYGLATTQRIRCYAKSAVSVGLDCKVIIANRCENKNNPRGNISPFGTIDGYSYLYIGGSTYIKNNKVYNKIIQGLDAIRTFTYALINIKKNDLVVFYSYNCGLLKLILTAAKIKRFKVYCEICEHPSIQFSGMKYNHDSPKHRKLLYKLICGFDGFLVISSSIKQLLFEIGIEDTKLHLVNIIIDADRFQGVVKQQSDFYLAYCGAADNNKDGVDQLIKAFALSSKKYPELKLYIIGPKQEDAINEKLAKNLGLEEKINFTGLVSSDEMPQLLKNAVGLVLNRPNNIQAKYGFPTKLGEYLLSGNPVIITKVGDIPLFLKDNKSAFLAEPDNIISFSSKIDELLSNQERARIIGQEGQKVANQNFTQNKVRNQLLTIFNA